MKELVVFNLDGTLAPSESSLDGEMSSLLRDLIKVVKVAIISGGAWQQFETQVLSKLPRDESLERLSILPACGTQFFQYDGRWNRLYAEDFSADEKEKIVSSLNQAVQAAGCWPGPQDIGLCQIANALTQFLFSIPHILTRPEPPDLAGSKCVPRVTFNAS